MDLLKNDKYTMEASKVDIFVVDPKEKTYLIECPKSISYFDFTNILSEKNIYTLKDYYIVFKGETYTEKKYEQILKFQNGDRVVIVNTREQENFYVKMHTNPNLNESNMVKGKLTGILRLILLKYISTCINNVNLIPSQEIRNIINELKGGMKLEESPEADIKSNLMEKSGGDIISYSNYVSSVINDDDLNNLLKLVGQSMENQIIKYWSILSKYEEFNKKFEAELFKAIKKSYFDYSLIGLSLYEQGDRIKYLKAKEDCPDPVITRYLFHGTQIDPISKIITGGFLYTRKPFYGMGIYFSDMLDYVSFYSGGNDFYSRRDNFGKILPVNSTFSCVSAEVFYCKRLKKEIYDFSYMVKELNHFPTYEEIEKGYKEKMVETNGVHYARVEPNKGQVRNKEDIIKDKTDGKFIGTEYVITEKSQMLPLYGLTFKRNEYFVLWRDPNFGVKNSFSNYLKERQLFIYQYAKMNAYFESSTEKALEIIKAKKFNKIILISSIGLDLSGKKFVEIARGILGFNVVVLFFSQNQKHLSWLQNFPNALYTNDASFYKDYIMNYNAKGLLNLKAKIENFYNIKLKFTQDFLKFPKFINQKEYDDIIFEEPSPYFKKVIIKNNENNSIFCMNENGTPCFYVANNFDTKSFDWYVTIIGNEITFFSNEYYLGVDLEKRKVTSEPYMKRFNYEKINDNEYIFYYKNKNNVLTVSGNKPSIQNENFNRTNQRFKLIESSLSI